MILDMFHVKHFRPIGAQNLTRPMTASFLGIVGSTDFFVQLESSVGASLWPSPLPKVSYDVRFIHIKTGNWGGGRTAAWFPPLPSSDNSSVIVAEHFYTGLRPSRVAISSDKARQAVHKAHLALPAGIRDRTGPRRSTHPARGFESVSGAEYNPHLG
jgi:hypothetical protein